MSSTITDMSRIFNQDPMKLQLKYIYGDTILFEFFFFTNIVRNTDNTINVSTSTAYSIENVTITGSVIEGSNSRAMDIKKYGSNGTTNKNSVLVSFPTTMLSNGSDILFNSFRDYPFKLVGSFPTGQTNSDDTAISKIQTIATGWIRLTGSAEN